MIKKTRHYRTQLAVVGAGFAGCAATVFALERGIKTIQIGNTGALAYTSGYLDLLGVDNAKYLKNPWEGLKLLREKEPDHPYSRLSDQDIRNAFEEFISALSQMGLSYTKPGTDNRIALLPAGACKPTYCLPETMQRSTVAMTSKAKVLIIDFFGLEGFSANEIVKNLSSAWPQLSARRISFPEMETGAQVFPEVMARALEVRSTREIFALRLKEVAGDAEYIAMPAILGIHKPDIIHLEMEQLTGLPIFEIPTIPPAVPGIRLRELFERQLAARGATFISQQKVKQVLLQEETINLTLKDNFGPIEIKTDKLLIASGRFLSGGLQADQHQVRESLLDLPVQQPGERDNWFNESYFDPAGHAINQSGLRVTDEFQPINEQGKVIDRRLYCAGILLANQDWVRQRCGAGLAIATAYKAINAMTST